MPCSTARRRPAVPEPLFGASLRARTALPPHWHARHHPGIPRRRHGTQSTHQQPDTRRSHGILPRERPDVGTTSWSKEPRSRTRAREVPRMSHTHEPASCGRSESLPRCPITYELVVPRAWRMMPRCCPFTSSLLARSARRASRQRLRLSVVVQDRCRCPPHASTLSHYALAPARVVALISGRVSLGCVYLDAHASSVARYSHARLVVRVQTMPVETTTMRAWCEGLGRASCRPRWTAMSALAFRGDWMEESAKRRSAF